MDESFGSRSSFQLLRSAQNGESQALEELYRRYLPVMTRLAHGRLPRWARDLVNTDDLVQETMIASLRRVDGVVYQHEGAFLAYLRKALLNRIRNEIRRAQRAPLVRTLGNETIDRPSPLQELMSKEKLRRFERAFERLKPVEQEAIVGRFEMRMKFKQLAEALGKTSVDAARMEAVRAVKKLLRTMNETGD